MTYFLYHEGCNIPDHVFVCLRNILTLSSLNKIVFCTNQNIKFNESSITVINLQDLTIPDVKNFLKSDPNPLWYTSLNRVFYLNSFVQLTKEPVIHFDNDVLCYYDFNLIKEKYIDEVYITPHKETEFTFGFSYIGNCDIMNTLTGNIYNLIQHGEEFTRKQTGDHIHEMRLLHFCGHDLIKKFDVFPTTGKEEYIFDPSSYGQYLDGTPNGEKPGYLDTSHIVGSKITSKCNILFNKKPYLVYNDVTFPIYNLHVHSKNLNKYTS